MKVKLKLTDIRSGQESLLLVTNLNAKGLLVQAAQTLPIGNRVKLHLQFEDGTPAIDLLGEVHKIALRRGGGRGMILRFLDPPVSAVERINQFLEHESRQNEAGPSERSQEAPSSNQTMVVDLNEPANIPLRPAQTSKRTKKQKPLSPTVDEEDFNDVDNLLGGDTRMLALNEFESFAKMQKTRPWLRWVFLGAFSLIMIPLLLFLGERLQLFGPERTSSSSFISPAPQITQIPSESDTVPKRPTQSTEPATSLPEGVTGITQIHIESSSKQVEVHLTATNEFPEPQIEKKSSPRRLILRFPNMKDFTINPVVPVSTSPLLRIRTSKSNEGLLMIFDLYPVAFPEFELKKQGATLTIYLYR